MVMKEIGNGWNRFSRHENVPIYPHIQLTVRIETVCYRDAKIGFHLPLAKVQDVQKLNYSGQVKLILRQGLTNFTCYMRLLYGYVTAMTPCWVR